MPATEDGLIVAGIPFEMTLALIMLVKVRLLLWLLYATKQKLGRVDR